MGKHDQGGFHAGNRYKQRRPDSEWFPPRESEQPPTSPGATPDRGTRGIRRVRGEGRKGN